MEVSTVEIAVCTLDSQLLSTRLVHSGQLILGKRKPPFGGSLCYSAISETFSSTLCQAISIVRQFSSTAWWWFQTLNPSEVSQMLTSSFRLLVTCPTICISWSPVFHFVVFVSLFPAEYKYTVWSVLCQWSRQHFLMIF